MARILTALALPALLLSLASGVSAPPLAPAQAQPAPMSAIPLVICPAGKGRYSGSAFRIGPTTLLTAAHLVRKAPCTIEGAPMVVLRANRAADYAILKDSRAGGALAIDCRGFQPGHIYIALGHARGIEQIVPVALVGTGAHSKDGFAILIGIFTTVPGQSGGAIIDRDSHAVVGIVNASDFEHGASASMELKNTSVCRGAAPVNLASAIR